MTADFSHVTFISAGAGSGKTYRLTEELEKALVAGVNPAHVIGTTFTVKAAAELEQKVRERLIGSGHMQLAEQMDQARVGTVHAVCESLLKTYSFDLGLSPQLNVMSLEDGQRLFNQALDEVLTLGKAVEMNALSRRLTASESGLEVPWQAEVKAVADKLRENDVNLAQAQKMGEDSATSLLGHFPSAMREVDTQKLILAVQSALAGIDTLTDTTQITEKYVQRLRQCIYQLRRDNCPWGVWVRLAVDASGKKSDQYAAAVRSAAMGYEASPAFQADLRAMIEEVFVLAAQAIDRFGQIKKERGLIDFLDMEQLMLGALDKPEVRSRLSEELDLLLVDEFQDTNPMQLALFVKLATLADRVIFVGDVKQAVYAFRGCDPELVFDALAGMTRANADEDVLARNWRSRASVVGYVNEVFASTFEGVIDRKHVELDPVREDTTAEPAVVRWVLEGRNRGDQVRSLCAGIADLVAGGFQISDPQTGDLRGLEWRDVAILAYTNAHVEEIAEALQDQRIPMKMTLKGLLKTPEVVFARACLRRLNDVSDTLATAEIVSMSEGVEPEKWLCDRLEYLAQGEDSLRWGENSHQVVRRLSELRTDSTFRSPVEVVARVTNDVYTRRIVTSWGPDGVKAAQRQRNLDAFLNLAVEYENHCSAHFDAASLTGFLFWLENPSSPELDLQPEVTGGNAVHVLTYHKSKGLEWPVVIATDFDHKRKLSIWGVRVEQQTPFDIDNPLAGRVVRYWPDPFSGRVKDIELVQTILNTPDVQKVQAGGAFEAQRLAYVGLTRAREANIFALKAGSEQAGWLGEFDPGFVLPQEESHELPNGRRVPAAVNAYAAGDALVQQTFTPIWFKTRPRRQYQSAFVRPSDAAPDETASPTELVNLGDRIKIAPGTDITSLGSAVHAIIAAEVVNPDHPQAAQSAQAILEAWGVGDAISVEDALAAARRFIRSLGAHRCLVEYPVTHVRDDGRIVRGWIDALVGDGKHWQIVDHKSSPRPRSEVLAEVRAYAGQLQHYADAIQAAQPKATVGQSIHFPITGLLAPLQKAELGQLDLFGDL
jgi:ATP-dependent exoDNAse (exonuclease V) beta subunit